MSWLRRLLLLAGLLTGAWLLGGAAEAHADVKVEIDGVGVELPLPLLDVGVEVETGLVPPEPDVRVPPEPDPRTEDPELAEPPPVVETPVQVEAPASTPAPALTPAPGPALTSAPVTPPQPVPHEEPRAERPVAGTLPQSGAGATANGTQLPVGTLPHVLRPPTTTASLISSEQHDAPRIVRAEEPTFSPD